MINGINASDPLSIGEPTGPSQELGQDAFLQLLISQMRNQDPLEPTSNDQFIAQLAQFSSLEEMEEVNENLLGLAVLQQSNALMSQLTDSSALIGRSVAYTHPVSGADAVGTVTSVKIEDGIAVLRIEGEDVPLVNVTEVTGDEPGSELDSSESDEGTGTVDEDPVQ